MKSIVSKLTIDECPKGYTAFVEKYKTDRIFRNRANCSGVYVKPNGSVSFENTKQVFVPNDFMG